jgi:hypothetical protein
VNKYVFQQEERTHKAKHDKTEKQENLAMIFLDKIFCCFKISDVIEKNCLKITCKIFYYELSKNPNLRYNISLFYGSEEVRMCATCIA